MRSEGPSFRYLKICQPSEAAPVTALIIAAMLVADTILSHSTLYGMFGNQFVSQLEGCFQKG